MMEKAAGPAFCTSTSEPIRRPQDITKQAIEPRFAHRAGEDTLKIWDFRLILPPANPYRSKPSVVRSW
jgi:hypothetical protein